MHPLNPKVVGLSVGVFWGLMTLAVGFLAALLDYGTAWVKLFSGFYIGYAPTVSGALVGLLWGFIDGLVGGAIFAVIYNFVERRVTAPPYVKKNLSR